MQLAEADESFVPSFWEPSYEPPEHKEEDDPCYHCGRAHHSCICPSAPTEDEVVEGQQFNASASHNIWSDDVFDGMPQAARAPVSYARTEGTKLKWVLNPETYRVAIVKKDGILEVKRVTDGAGYCHDAKTCRCKPCGEISLSNRLGVPMPPWLKGVPLVKTFFATEAAWRISLPFGGDITATEPQISDRALRALCMKPLEATTDALRLKELEERFPGAKMVLSVWGDRQYEITYKESPGYDSIHCEDAQISGIFFAQFGACGKPQLMAVWRGLYIDLSHLF